MDLFEFNLKINQKKKLFLIKSQLLVNKPIFQSSKYISMLDRNMNEWFYIFCIE
jgi:hypothetical protein